MKNPGRLFFFERGPKKEALRERGLPKFQGPGCSNEAHQACQHTSRQSLQPRLLHTLSDVLWPIETNIQHLLARHCVAMATALLLTTPHRCFFFFFSTATFPEGWFQAWQLAIQLVLPHFKVKLWHVASFFFFPPQKSVKEDENDSGQMYYNHFRSDLISELP